MKRFFLGAPLGAALLFLAPPTPAGAAPRPAPRRPSAKRAAPKAPARKAPAAAAKTVRVAGQVEARLKGQPTRLVIMGDVKHLDVLLEPEGPAISIVNPGRPRPQTLRFRTDPQGAFALDKVPPGKYVLRVRIPELPQDLDNAELYRARIQIKAGAPPPRQLLQIPFLMMHALAPDGQPVQWDTLQMQVRRQGPELNQEWGMEFRRAPGANPTGPLEEKGAILMQIRREEGSVSISYSWSSKQKNLLLFPLVEEDGRVEYTMTMKAPGLGASGQKFLGDRGKSPAEVDFRLQPYTTVAGSLRAENVQTTLAGARVSLSVYDPANRDVLLHTDVTSADAEGKFRFADVPAGTAWLSVSAPNRGPDAAPRLLLAGDWVILKGAGGGAAPVLTLSSTSTEEATRKASDFPKARPE